MITLNKKIWNSQFEGREEKPYKYYMYCKLNERLVIKDIYIYKELYLWFRVIFSFFIIFLIPFRILLFGIVDLKNVFESLNFALFNYRSSKFTDIKTTNEKYIKYKK